VIFNGEIYNFADVRRELAALGHRFRTNSDTEVIAHGYEQWGERCVDRFRGMFAFAVWDGTTRRLLLARDRLGVKPLYYAEVPGGIVFGSEIKSLLADPEVSALHSGARHDLSRHSQTPAGARAGRRAGIDSDLPVLGSPVHRRR
jgi:asparagine synthase (glutamine-hydrolysing)